MEDIELVDRDAVGAEGARAAARARRLRHRLLVAARAAALPGRRASRSTARSSSRSSTTRRRRRSSRPSISLSHALGLRTVAEGIETVAQVDRLRGARLRPGAGLLLRQAGPGGRTSDREADDLAADEQRHVELPVGPDRGAERVVLRRATSRCACAVPVARSTRCTSLPTGCVRIVEPFCATYAKPPLTARPSVDACARERRDRRDRARAPSPRAVAAREAEVGRPPPAGVEGVELLGRARLAEVVAPVVGDEQVGRRGTRARRGCATPSPPGAACASRGPTRPRARAARGCRTGSRRRRTGARPAPCTIESIVCRPTCSPSSAIECLAKRLPSNPVNAVTRPLDGEVMCDTYRLPPAQRSPSAVCRWRTTWRGLPPLGTYQTPSEGFEPPAPDVTHIPPAGSKTRFVANGMPFATTFGVAAWAPAGIARAASSDRERAPHQP